MQREKRRLADEIENVNNQLLETQSRVTDAERRLKSSETERSSLEGELEDQKDALQLETTRYQGLVQQLEKLKLETDKRVAEKDDELDALKLQQKRQVETLQAVVEESENRGKQEINGLRKKMGTELDEALQQLEAVKKQKSDQEFGVKKLQLTNKELGDQLGEERNQHEITRDQLATLGSMLKFLFDFLRLEIKVSRVAVWSIFEDWKYSLDEKIKELALKRYVRLWALNVFSEA